MNETNNTSGGGREHGAPRRPSRPVIAAVIIGAVLVIGGGTAWAFGSANADPGSDGTGETTVARGAESEGSSTDVAADTAVSPAPSAPDGTVNSAQEAAMHEAEQQVRRDDERIARGAETALAVEQFRADAGSARSALGAGADLTPLLDRLHADSSRVRSSIVAAATDGAALDAFGEVERALDALTAAAITPESSAPAALQSLEDALLRLTALVQNPK